MKFLADEMAGDICRWLRMMGYDTSFAKDYEEKYGNPVMDDRLIDECFEDHRILISRDQEMVRKMDEKFGKFLKKFPDKYKLWEIHNSNPANEEIAIIKPYLLLKTKDLLESLKVIYHKFPLSSKYDANIARCPKCNNNISLIENKSDYIDDIPKKVYDYQEKFWICTNPDCRKIYWKGTHFSDILEKLEKIRD